MGKTMDRIATLEDLADVLSRLTYDDRMEFARFIEEAAAEWAEAGEPTDTDYFATLMSSFVEEFSPDEQAAPEMRKPAGF